MRLLLCTAARLPHLALLPHGQRLAARLGALSPGRPWWLALALFGTSTTPWADGGPRPLAAAATAATATASAPAPVPSPAPALSGAQASRWQLPTAAAAEAARTALDRPVDDPITVRLAPGGEQQSPDSCRALLAVQARITGTRPAGDWDVLQQRLADCQALLWWSQVKPPAHTTLAGLPAAAHTTRLWPAQLWPAVSDDEQQAQQRPGQTLQSLSGQARWRVKPAARPASPNPNPNPKANAEARFPTWTLQARGYTVTLQWLAHGDFDGDGWEDWLLHWQAQATDGRWRTVRSLLLSRSAGEAGFHVVLPPDPPR